MKLIYQLIYQLKATQHNLKEHWGSLLLSLSAVGFTMLLFAAYLLLLTNFQAVSKRLDDQLQIVVYLEEGISERESLKIKALALQQDAVEKVQYFSPHFYLFLVSCSDTILYRPFQLIFWEITG